MYKEILKEEAGIADSVNTTVKKISLYIKLIKISKNWTNIH